MFVLYLVAFFILLGAVGLGALYHSKKFKMTSRGKGWVVRSEERRVKDDAGVRSETVVVCKYAVRGQEYELTRSFDGFLAAQFPEGREVPILYNPAEPGMARIAMGE